MSAERAGAIARPKSVKYEYTVTSCGAARPQASGFP